ncbi:Cu/Pi carrier [Mycoemilia scoparia]|uniref:Cu/Pi carrier n=1 Tax=Mycoemilia scoparia TaxID=417184 RepID=A0A9W7ZX82_9FUNG|nr:Cu/Pi carrier [Mycoemilia scoparia]
MFPSQSTLKKSFTPAEPKAFVAPSVVEKPSAKPFVAAAPIEINSAKYFYTCAVGGALACGLTHTFVTPLDLVKCRLQVDKTLYNGIFDGWKKIFKAEGISGLFTGWGPTFIGYTLQGTCKYGFYDYFKYLYPTIVGEETANKYRTLLYLSASASAEVIADVALCPLEATKIRMQTSTTPFASSTLEALRKINAAEGLNGFYKGLTPLWLRQVPYTMVKFATFEKTVEAIYKHCLSHPKEYYNKAQQLGVTFTAGYIAGIFCAIVSHPADTLVSKLNNVAKSEGESTGTLAVKILKDLGFKGVWAGLTPRIMMVGTLTALQWFIYDTFKVMTGLPASGSAAPKKE